MEDTEDSRASCLHSTITQEAGKEGVLAQESLRPLFGERIMTADCVAHQGELPYKSQLERAASPLKPRDTIQEQLPSPTNGFLATLWLLQ